MTTRTIRVLVLLPAVVMLLGGLAVAQQDTAPGVAPQAPSVEPGQPGAPGAPGSQRPPAPGPAVFGLDPAIVVVLGSSLLLVIVALVIVAMSRGGGGRRQTAP